MMDTNSFINETAGLSKEKGPSVTDVLEMFASKDKKILISIVDYGFVEMAINLYLACMQPQKIYNYLIRVIFTPVIMINFVIILWMNCSVSAHWVERRD